MAGQQPTVCPKCGLPDRVEKVIVAYGSGTEIMRGRLAPPREPQSDDTAFRALPPTPLKSPKPLEPYIPASEFRRRLGWPSPDWSRPFGTLVALGCLFLWAFPWIIIFMLGPIAALTILLVMYLSGITPSDNSGFYFLIGIWSIIGLLLDIFFIWAWVGWREKNKQIRLRNDQIQEENKRIDKENSRITQENEQLRATNAKRRRQYEAVHAHWQAQRKIWEEELYYCYRDDVVFMPGDSADQVVRPEYMGQLLDRVVRG